MIHHHHFDTNALKSRLKSPQGSDFARVDSQGVMSRRAAFSNINKSLSPRSRSNNQVRFSECLERTSSRPSIAPRPKSEYFDSVLGCNDETYQDENDDENHGFVGSLKSSFTTRSVQNLTSPVLFNNNCNSKKNLIKMRFFIRSSDRILMFREIYRSIVGSPRLV